MGSGVNGEPTLGTAAGTAADPPPASLQAVIEREIKANKMSFMGSSFRRGTYIE
jgi:hypothetical protein